MIQVANAPCSWGALEFELEGKSMGYQQVLDEMVQTGYAGTELGDWGFMPSTPKELLTKMESNMRPKLIPASKNIRIFKQNRE